MKKRALLLGILFVFVFSIFFASAAVNTSTICGDDDEDCKVDKAYACLNEKIDDETCSGLSSEDRLFAFLATGDCRQEVLNDSKYESDLRYTSIAAIGLQSHGSSTTDVETWILEQERDSIGLDWFLEIESSEAVTCTVQSSNSNTIVINEDKQITSLTGGSCLTLAQGGYWLEIDSNCYDENFTISCDQTFLTTLLYQRQGSDTIYISEATHSSSAQGETTEKVNSLCFKTGSSCNYEGSLWAALALLVTGNEPDAYLPYLITLAEDNEDLLPESFLYYLTGNSDFRNQLFGKQINNKWFVSLNDRYYGTAVAMYPFKYEDSTQKSGVMDWLLNEVQNGDGCWDSGNIRSTSFILASLWPRGTVDSGSNGTSTLVDCEASGFSCTSRVNCDGEILSNYYCSSTFVCCSEAPIIETCAEQGGLTCNTGQRCSGISAVTVSAAGLGLGQICCVSGSCQTIQDTTTDTTNGCEDNGGTCRPTECAANEEEAFEFSCNLRGDFCCISKSSSEGKSLLWLWLLLLLIIFVVLAIIFRDKIREFWIRMNSGSKKQPPSGAYSRIPPRGSPPGPSVLNRPLARPQNQMQRRPIPGKNPPGKSSGELDDVLKKLKEMGR